MENKDIGLTHIAFAVKDLDASIAFYQQFADMKVIHRRGEKGSTARPVAWLSDMTRHFAIVLAEDPETPIPNSALSAISASPVRQKKRWMPNY